MRTYYQYRYQIVTKLPKVTSERQKELTFNALLSLFFAVAEQRPLVLCVEDLHWADPSTLEFLALLIEDAPTTQIYVLCLARPEFVPSWSTTQILQFRLSRLEKNHIAEMVMAITKNKTLPEEVLATIIQRTDGISLFVEELTRMLLKPGFLQEHEHHYTLIKPLSELAIPATLRDLLTSKLDQLGRAKETTQIAAALGREFNYELLVAVSPLDRYSLDQHLNTLMDADLVKRRRRDQSTYLFKHALIRDTAYESLPINARQITHREIAATIEHSFPDLKETRPDLLAYHHAAANQQRQALDYALTAGRNALKRSDHEESINQIKQALDWLDSIEDEPERLKKELALNGVMMPALFAAEGYVGPQLDIITTRSMQLIDSLGDTPQVFPTLWMMNMYHHMRAQRKQAREN